LEGKGRTVRSEQFTHADEDAPVVGECFIDDVPFIRDAHSVHVDRPEVAGHDWQERLTDLDTDPTFQQRPELLSRQDWGMVAEDLAVVLRDVDDGIAYRVMKTAPLGLVFALFIPVTGVTWFRCQHRRRSSGGWHWCFHQC
jgi:hypothetical protein